MAWNAKDRSTHGASGVQVTETFGPFAVARGRKAFFGDIES